MTAVHTFRVELGLGLHSFLQRPGHTAFVVLRFLPPLYQVGVAIVVVVSHQMTVLKESVGLHLDIRVPCAITVTSLA